MMTAKDAKNRFGELMDTVQREPVTIEKHGRPVAVVLSVNSYPTPIERRVVSVATPYDYSVVDVRFSSRF